MLALAHGQVAADLGTIAVASKPEAAEGSEKRLMNVKEAAAYLGTTPSTLYTKVWRHEVPFVKLGRSVRFDVKDLDELIERSRVKPRELPMSPEKFER